MEEPGPFAQEIVLTVSGEHAKHRLDAYLASQLPDLSRMRIQTLIRAGLVTVEGHVQKPGFRVRPGQEVVVRVPPPPEPQLAPEQIPLNVVYEDEDILIINKPSGISVHPGAGRPSGTLANAILAHDPNIFGVGSPLRPGIVHRLDKDTSGLLAVARNNRSYLFLSNQIKERKVSRHYLALVYGDIPHEGGTIEAPIGRHPAYRKRMAVVPTGRHAVTRYRVLERFGEYTLVEASLQTGRTHQIRVHFSHIGHPVVGDRIYASRRTPFGLIRQALHAYKLTLVHPRRGERMEFTAPLPQDMEDALKVLRQRPRSPWERGLKGRRGRGRRGAREQMILKPWRRDQS